MSTCPWMIPKLARVKCCLRKLGGVDTKKKSFRKTGTSRASSSTSAPRTLWSCPSKLGIEHTAKGPVSLPQLGGSWA